MLMMMDTEPEFVVVSPEVEFVDQVVQIHVGPEKCTINAGGGKKREGKAHTVSEEVFVDYRTGSWAGIKAMGESTSECPVVFASPQSQKLSLNLGPLLAAPD